MRSCSSGVKRRLLVRNQSAVTSSFVVPGRQADGHAIHPLRVADIGVLADHEAMAVIEVHRDHAQAERGVARHGQRGLADQHVDLARLQRGEALHRGQRHEADLVRVAEQRRREAAAEIGIHAAPDALAVRQGEAGDADIDAAVQRAAGLDVVEGLPRLRGSRCRGRARAGRPPSRRRRDMRSYPQRIGDQGTGFSTSVFCAFSAPSPPVALANSAQAGSAAIAARRRSRSPSEL